MTFWNYLTFSPELEFVKSSCDGWYLRKKAFQFWREIWIQVSRFSPDLVSLFVGDSDHHWKWMQFSKKSCGQKLFFYLEIWIIQLTWILHAPLRRRRKVWKSRGEHYYLNVWRKSISFNFRGGVGEWAHTQFGPKTTLAPHSLWPQAYFGPRHISAQGVLRPQ